MSSFIKKKTTILIVKRFQGKSIIIEKKNILIIYVY